MIGRGEPMPVRVSAPGYPRRVLDRKGNPMVIHRATDRAIARDLAQRRRREIRDAELKTIADSSLGAAAARKAA
jgi:hypothetical protein